MTKQYKAWQSSLLTACLNSFALDFVARTAVGGSHLNFFILKQLPVLTPRDFKQLCDWDRNYIVGDWMLPRILELTYTAWDMAPFASDLGYNGPPFIWNSERRFWLRAELDAAFFHLYGIERGDVAYIMDTFPIVKRKDIEAYGSFRTKEAILSIFDEMTVTMHEGPTVPNTVSFDVFYPSTQADEYLCAVTLDALTKCGSLNSDEMLDVLLLAAHPDRMGGLLSDTDKLLLDPLLTSLPTSGATIGSVRWRDCLKHLERGAHAIAVDRNSSPFRIRADKLDASVRARYPQVPNEFVGLLLKALARLALPIASLQSAERMIRGQFDQMREAEIASL